MRSHSPTVLSRLALLGLALALSGLLVACGNSAGQDTPAAQQPSEQPSAEQTAPAPDASRDTSAPEGMEPVTELKTEDLEVGSGAEATSGKQVTVHYTGWLVDGTKFDSSRDSGNPFTFALGSGQVIPGWDQGVAGMKVGGLRRLHIPPDLAYGAQGAPPVIPPDSTLVFDVELLDVQ